MLTPRVSASLHSSCSEKSHPSSAQLSEIWQNDSDLVSSGRAKSKKYITFGGSEGTSLGHAVPAVPSATRGWRCCLSSYFSRQCTLCALWRALFLAPQGVLIDDCTWQESFLQPESVCSCYVRSLACSCWNSPTRLGSVSRERTKCLQELSVAGFCEAFFFFFFNAYLQTVSVVGRWWCSGERAHPDQETGSSNSISDFDHG